MRLFLAVMLPEDLRNELGQLVKELSRTRAVVKWVNADAIHVTLKFLGEVEEERLQELYEASRLASKEVKPFRLTVSGVGAFPNVKRPRVVWVGIDRSSPLSTLQGRIEEGFGLIGFPSEKRPWTPHLTIGRVKGDRNLRELEEKLSHANFRSSTFIVKEFHLVRSILKPDGPVYTSLKMIPLEAGN